MVKLTMNVSLCTIHADKLSVNLTGREITEHVLFDTDVATRDILNEFYSRGCDLKSTENNWPYSRKFHLDDGSLLEVNLSKAAHQVDSSFSDIRVNEDDYAIFDVSVNNKLFTNIWEAVDFAIETICEEGENK